MAVADPVVAPRTPRTTGLRREIGFIGLLWASGGSIIGSGWLFGAQGALAAAGPAAIISWVPLWWDMLVVVAFSLAIYFWAMRVALPAATIEAMIEGRAAQEEPATAYG